MQSIKTRKGIFESGCTPANREREKWKLFTKNIILNNEFFHPFSLKN